MGSAALVIRAGWANLPSGADWPVLNGTSILTGIGFTMSLVIGTLAFGESNREAGMRLGALVGSALVGILGAIVLSLPARGSFPLFGFGHRLRSGNNSRSPARDGGQMPRSVISAVTSRAGVTSKA